MSRPIKFRAWSKKTKKIYKEVIHVNLNSLEGIWVTVLRNDPIECKNVNYFIQPEHCELMQFTGRIDKNGKEIFEGDICNLEIKGFNTNSILVPFLIVFNVDGFQGCNLRKIKTDFLNSASLPLPRRFNYKEWGRLEVIGNFYENKELLK